MHLVHLAHLAHLAGLAPRVLSRRARLAPALALLPALGGCVRFYHPMTGVHRPVVVNPRLPNLDGLSVTVRCVPEGLLTVQEATTLCQKVGTLLEVQGARVRTAVSAHAPPDDELEAAASEGTDADAGAPSDLTVELRARRVHQSTHPLSWVLCIGSLTVFPGVLEHTFAQDVAVRDATGFLLVNDEVEGRIVEHFGLGPWAGNVLVDLVARDRADDLAGDAFDRAVSEDVYGRLSQLLFDARMRWEVLRQVPPTRAQ